MANYDIINNLRCIFRRLANLESKSKSNTECCAQHTKTLQIYDDKHRMMKTANDAQDDTLGEHTNRLDAMRQTNDVQDRRAKDHASMLDDHENKIDNLQNRNIEQDCEINGLKNKNSDQDDEISNLKQTSVQHNNNLEAHKSLHQDLHDTVSPACGTIVGNLGGWWSGGACSLVFVNVGEEEKVYILTCAHVVGSYSDYYYPHPNSTNSVVFTDLFIEGTNKLVMFKDIVFEIESGYCDLALHEIKKDHVHYAICRSVALNIASDIRNGQEMHVVGFSLAVDHNSYSNTHVRERTHLAGANWCEAPILGEQPQLMNHGPIVGGNSGGPTCDSNGHVTSVISCGSNDVFSGARYDVIRCLATYHLLPVFLCEIQMEVQMWSHVERLMKYDGETGYRIVNSDRFGLGLADMYEDVPPSNALITKVLYGHDSNGVANWKPVGRSKGCISVQEVALRNFNPALDIDHLEIKYLPTIFMGYNDNTALDDLSSYPMDGDYYLVDPFYFGEWVSVNPYNSSRFMIKNTKVFSIRETMALEIELWPFFGHYMGLTGDGAGGVLLYNNWKDTELEDYVELTSYIGQEITILYTRTNIDGTDISSDVRFTEEGGAWRVEAMVGGANIYSRVIEIDLIGLAVSVDMFNYAAEPMYLRSFETSIWKEDAVFGAETDGVLHHVAQPVNNNTGYYVDNATTMSLPSYNKLVSKKLTQKIKKTAQFKKNLKEGLKKKRGLDTIDKFKNLKLNQNINEIRKKRVERLQTGFPFLKNKESDCFCNN